MTRFFFFLNKKTFISNLIYPTRTKVAGEICQNIFIKTGISRDKAEFMCVIFLTPEGQIKFKIFNFLHSGGRQSNNLEECWQIF